MNNLMLEPHSTAGDFLRTFTVRDTTTDEPYDLSDVTAIGVSLRLAGCERLRASSASGEVVIDDDPATGRFTVEIPFTRFRDFRSGAYSLGVVISDATQRVQLVLGTLPIVEGHPHELA